MIRVLSIVVVIAFGVPLFIGLTRRPQRGVLVLAALVPFDGLLQILHVPPGTRSYKEVIVVATLLATFVAPQGARAAERTRKLPPWALAAGGLLALGLFSAFQVSKIQALTGLRIDFFYLLLALAIWRCPLTARDRDRLVTILMTTGAITAVLGIADEVVGISTLHRLGFAYDSTIRTTGSNLRAFSTFASPFPFAFFLMVVILVCLPAALGATGRLRNRLFLISLPILGVALLFTFVRGAWLGLAAGWIYLGWRHRRVLLLAVVLAGVVFLYLPGSIASSSVSSTSLAQRGAGWSQNFDQVVSHPFGVGIGATGAAANVASELEAKGQQVDTSVPGTSTYQPDNYYYKTVYELGVLGLWMLVLLLISAFSLTAVVARGTSGTESSFAFGVAACTLAVAVASLVTTYLEIFPMDVLFWMLLAAATAGMPRGVEVSIVGPASTRNSRGTPHDETAAHRTERRPAG